MTIGLTIDGRYNILKKLGEGRLGEFFEVRNLLTNALCIAKLYYKEDDPAYSSEISTELEKIKWFKRIRHPALTTILEVFQYKGQHIVVFQTIEGISIDIFINTHYTITPSERMIKIISSLLEIVIFLHKQAPPLFLGPIPPSKILLTSTGPKLLQFELNTIYGKPPVFSEDRFYPPEINVENKESTPEKYGIEEDLYSISALLYYLLDKKPPPPATYTGIIEVQNPHVEPEIKNVITQCLKPNPQERINSAVIFKQIIEKSLSPKQEPQEESETITTRLAGRLEQWLVEFRFFWKTRGEYFIIPFIILFIIASIVFTIKKHEMAKIEKSPLLSMTHGTILRVINTATKKQYYSTDLKSKISSLYFLPSENLISVITTSPSIFYLYELKTGKIAYKEELGDELNSTAYNPKNEFLYYILKGGREIKTIIPGAIDNNSNKSKISSVIKLKNEAQIISVDRSGLFLYLGNTSKNSITIVDLITKQEVSEIPLEGNPVLLLPIETEKALVIEKNKAGISIIDGQTKKIIARYPLPFLDISKGVVSDNGNKVFLWNTTQARLAVITELNNPKIQQMPLSFIPQHIFLSEHTGLIYVSDSSGNIHILNISDLQEVGSFYPGNKSSDFIVITSNK